MQTQRRKHQGWDSFSGSSATVFILYKIIQTLFWITVTRSFILNWLKWEWIDLNMRPTAFFCIISKHCLHICFGSILFKFVESLAEAAIWRWLFSGFILSCFLCRGVEASWSVIDNKAIQETDSKIENTLMKADKAEIRSQCCVGMWLRVDLVKLYSDVTDWPDSLCVWL